MQDERVKELVALLCETHAVWMKDYGPHHAVLDTTARSRIFFCHFYSLAHAALDDREGILFGDDQQQKYISFDGRASIRLKKFGRQFQTRNYPTPHAVEWTKQASLDGMPPVGRLELGYRFDLLEIAIRDIFITHPNGVRGIYNDWVWQIYGEPIGDTFGIQGRLLNKLSPDDVYWYDNIALSK